MVNSTIYIVDDFLRMQRKATIYTEDSEYFYILLSDKFSVRARKSRTYLYNDTNCLAVKYENLEFDHCIRRHHDE